MTNFRNARNLFSFVADVVCIITCTTSASALLVRAGRCGHARERAVPFERVPLGSHVAVRDGPPLALPAHCFAGDDGRHRERHGREQEPAHLRRVCHTAGWKLLVAADVWHFQSMPLPWCSSMGLQWFLWQHPPAVQCGQPRSFWSLSDHLLGSNGRWFGGFLWLACNRYKTSSAGACGDRPDWPVFDHFGRHILILVPPLR